MFSNGENKGRESYQLHFKLQLYVYKLLNKLKSEELFTE